MIPISKNRPKVGDFQPHQEVSFFWQQWQEVRRKALDFDANNLVSFAEPLGARWWEDTPRLSQQFSAFQQRKRSKCAEVRSLGWQAHHWNSARSLGTAHAQLTTGVLRMVSWGVPWGISEMFWRYPHFRKPPVGWLWIPKLTAGNAPIKPYLCTYTSVLRLGIDIPDKREWRTCHSSSLKASSKIRFYLRSWNFLGNGQERHAKLVDQHPTTFARRGGDFREVQEGKRKKSAGSIVFANVFNASCALQWLNGHPHWKPVCFSSCVHKQPIFWDVCNMFADGKAAFP